MYEVIVSLCCSRGHFYKEEERQVFVEPRNAILFAKPKIKKGVGVIIRPQFNESNAEGETFFRDFVSVDGAPFVEKVFFPEGFLHEPCRPPYELSADKLKILLND